MNSSSRMAFLLVGLVSAACANEPKKTRASLNQEQVKAIAEKYAEANGLKSAEHEFSALYYFEPTDKWRVFFGSNSLEIGDHGFWVEIDDNNPEKIETEPE